MTKADKLDRKAARTVQKAKAAAGTGAFWPLMKKAADLDKRAEIKRLKGKS